MQVRYTKELDGLQQRLSGQELYNCLDMLAVLHVTLGINHIETEENQSGEAEIAYGLSYLFNRLGIQDVALPEKTSASCMSNTLSTRAPTLQLLLEDEVGGQASTSCQTSVLSENSLTLLDYASLAITAIEGCNYLSLIYSGWDNHPRALRMLLAARQIHVILRSLHHLFLIRTHEVKNLDSLPNIVETMNRFPLYAGAISFLGFPYMDMQGNPLPQDLHALLCIAFDQLDSLFTHTLFYFAQVYGHLQDVHCSAFYIASTLSRQLLENEVSRLARNMDNYKDNDTTSADNEVLGARNGPEWSRGASNSSLDKREWTRNALKLGQYYFSKDQLSIAAVYYYAAETMLGVHINELRNRDVQSASACSDSTTSDVNAVASTPEASASNMTSFLPDTVQRLVGEIAIHWGNLYLDMLHTLYIEKMEKNDETMSVMTTSSDPSDHNISQAYPAPKRSTKISDLYRSRHVDKHRDEVTFQQPDPFFTGPLISFHRGNGSKKDRFVGDGIDRIDLSVIKHEGGMVLLLERHLKNEKEYSHDSFTAELSGEDVIHTFIMEKKELSKDYIVSYGPRTLGNLQSPGTVNMSNLAAFPDLDHMESYDDAKSLFKASINAFTQGMKYFSFDGHVTEYIHCQSSVSKLYEYLCPWEDNYKRQSAMHIKRATSLIPIVDSLNPNVFGAYIVQLSLDIANAFAAAFESRLQLYNSPENNTEKKPYTFKDVLETAQKALIAYLRFFKCFSDPRIPNPPMTPDNQSVKPDATAMELSDGTLVPYLKAHFRVARILSGMVHESLVEKTKFAEMAIHRFKWIADNAPKLLGDEQYIFATELAISKQMIELLPQKVMFYRRGIDLS